jgi:dinuclear metal center YbgI/SA1388 family protein
MQIKEILQHLEQWAPPVYQEGYDNSGLITGDRNQEVSGILISLDCTEPTIEEAIEKNCNLIIAHHPIVFKGLKSLTGKNYVERTIIKAIQNNIAIYATHTNLDHVSTGVNDYFAKKIGLINTRILAPKKGLLYKLETYVPATNLKEVQEALWKAGAGNIGNYSNCSFNHEGKGTFMANEKANPFVGKANELHTEDECKVEVIIEKHAVNSVLSALQNAHPYESVAYQLIPTENYHPNIGAGMIGELPEEKKWQDLFSELKKTFGIGAIKHTKPIHEKVKTIAICGGSGSFLLQNAKSAKADLFITGDFKYHEFFDAEDQIMIADIGHFESEHLTIERIEEKIQEKNCSFAIYRSSINTNPISYF